MEAQAEIKWADLPSPPGPIQLFTFLFFKLHKLSANATGLSVLTSLGFGFAMIQVDEYLAAIVCWFLGALIFLAKSIHWKVNGRLVVTTLGKLAYGLAAIVFFLFLYIWTEVKRGDKPLSILIFPKDSKLETRLETDAKLPVADKRQEQAKLEEQPKVEPKKSKPVEKPKQAVPKVEPKTEEPKPEPAKPQPDVSIRVVKVPLLGILVLNTSADKNVVREPRYEASFWDLDLPEGNESLTMWWPSLDWLRADEMAGPFAPFHSSAANRVKEGHRIFGYIMVTCPNCIRTKSYWVYTVYGGEGKYAQLPTGRYPNPVIVVKNVIPLMRKETPEAVLSGLGQLEWIPIVNWP